MANVPIAFSVLPNFYWCFCNLIEIWKIFSIPNSETFHFRTRAEVEKVRNTLAIYNNSVCDTQTACMQIMSKFHPAIYGSWPHVHLYTWWVRNLMPR